MLCIREHTNQKNAHIMACFFLLITLLLPSALLANDDEFDLVVKLVISADGNYDHSLRTDLTRVVDNMKERAAMLKGTVLYGAILCKCQQNSTGVEKDLFAKAAQSVFDTIPRTERNLSHEFRVLVGGIRTNCGNESLNIRQFAVNLGRTGTSSAASVTGKGGKRKQITFSSGGQGSEEDLKKRRCERSNRQMGVRKIKELVGDDYIVGAGANFIVAIHEGDANDINDLLARMEDILARFCKLYNMQAPEHLITVYQVENSVEMVELAQKVHNVSIPDDYFGYSVAADSSIVVKKSWGLGTFGHELFHALLDYNFPKASPWFNEGMASLYEEYMTTADGGILGTFRKDHWRLEYLRYSGGVSLAKAPSIKRIIEMDWEAFDAIPSPEILQLHHVTAKLFVMFLQDEKMLERVFSRMRGIGIGDLKGSMADMEIKMLEEVCGKELDALQKAFNSWFVAKTQP